MVPQFCVTSLALVISTQWRLFPLRTCVAALKPTPPLNHSECSIIGGNVSELQCERRSESPAVAAGKSFPQPGDRTHAWCLSLLMTHQQDEEKHAHAQHTNSPTNSHSCVGLVPPMLFFFAITGVVQKSRQGHKDVDGRGEALRGRSRRSVLLQQISQYGTKHETSADKTLR